MYVMKTQQALAVAEKLFTAKAKSHTPGRAERNRKPQGNGDQRTCED